MPNIREHVLRHKQAGYQQANEFYADAIG